MYDPSDYSILLIDDDMNLLRTLRDFLQFEGYNVAIATSGEEGLKKVSEATPDLIILDIGMPGMGGIAFLRELSSMNGAAGISVLVFTARTNLEEFFGEMDVAGFVAKPCDPDELLARIKTVLMAGKGKTGDAVEPAGMIGTMKLLLAEDEPGQRETLRSAFTQAGFEVVVVTSGPEVMERVIIEKPDVLLMKLVMEGMNGDTVASMLKEIPGTKGVPVVLYDDTGSAPRDRAFRDERQKHRKFVASVNAADLLPVVESIFRR